MKQLVVALLGFIFLLGRAWIYVRVYNGPIMYLMVFFFFLPFLNVFLRNERNKI